LENITGRNHMTDLGVDWRIVLNCQSTKEAVKIRTGFN
jgi:hypothetical protein